MFNWCFFWHEKLETVHTHTYTISLNESNGNQTSGMWWRWLRGRMLKSGQKLFSSKELPVAFIFSTKRHPWFHRIIVAFLSSFPYFYHHQIADIIGQFHRFPKEIGACVFGIMIKKTKQKNTGKQLTNTKENQKLMRLTNEMIREPTVSLKSILPLSPLSDTFLILLYPIVGK